jgi:hypothetical protein
LLYLCSLIISLYMPYTILTISPLPGEGYCKRFLKPFQAFVCRNNLQYFIAQRFRAFLAQITVIAVHNAFRRVAAADQYRRVSMAAASLTTSGALFVYGLEQKQVGSKVQPRSISLSYIGPVNTTSF